MPSLLANRYTLIADESGGGRLPFRARDAVFNRVVVLKSLGFDFGENSQAYETLTHCHGALRGLPSRHLVRYFGVEETQDDFLLAREWVPGFSLLELLLQRRDLRVREWVQLLTPLPEALDQIARAGLPLPRSLLNKVIFATDENADSTSLADSGGDAAVERQSRWQLKLNPISLESFGLDPNKHVTTLAPQQSIAGWSAATDLLSHLLYEVLGGHRRADNRLAPLAKLGEQENALLRALENGDYADCTTFWRDFTRALHLEVAPPELAIPKQPRNPQAWETTGVFEPGASAEVLRLIPNCAEAIPIHLVARSCFRIGRAHYEADFTARLLPETAENYERTGRISRVHVRGEILAGQICLRDGNGTNASHNGSWFNNRPLAADPPMPLLGRGVLNLANEYRLEVLPLFYDHLCDCQFNDFFAETALSEQEPETVSSPGLHGSVAFIPLDAQKPLCDAIWLFSGIGFGLDGAGEVVWNYHGEGESPGAILRHKDCFWIKNLMLPEGALSIGGTVILHGQIAPLAAGQTLQLGARIYRLEQE